VAKPKPKAMMIAAAVAVSAPMAIHFEGTVLHPYRDMGGYESVCNGERYVAMHDYTKAACLEMLKQDQAQVYAPEVYACSPEIADNPYFLGPAIDAAWNAGAGGWCKSPMAAKFKSRDNVGACEAFKDWRSTVHGIEVRGLENRRDYDPMSEFHICQKGLANV